MDDDLRAIEATVQAYLDGLYEGDTDKIARAFHPTSALTDCRDGKINIVPRDAWLEMVRKRPSPKAQGLPRHDKILSIDRTGPLTAMVKLNCAIPPRFFTDYLSLLKIDGRWQVVQKVYATETRG